MNTDTRLKQPPIKSSQIANSTEFRQEAHQFIWSKQWKTKKNRY